MNQTPDRFNLILSNRYQIVIKILQLSGGWCLYLFATDKISGCNPEKSFRKQ